MKCILIKDNELYKVKNKIDLEGFYLQSKNKSFTINGEKITQLMIVHKKLAHPLVYKIVIKKYNNLIKKLTDLLFSDDDSGASIMQILNMIEKFKQEIKNKYRKYLKKKELEDMGEKLIFFQKQAQVKQIAINSYYNNYKSSNRAK